MSGTVMAKPISGLFTRDTELLGTMDIYLTCDIDG
jgi:hypothetical protein